ncbi:hypothetical protein BZG36_02479 [Bifiguratus adelaidae]|uniref:Dynein heavy chain, cytoplasmic n=1 Tax=Bifiguratus adelaidae TaxID=1938954 RepID=A0A261Y107_9FUNG|nr:hypothetical protein BZG36_02479 [Bifiguratus adelaidae]
MEVEAPLSVQSPSPTPDLLGSFDPRKLELYLRDLLPLVFGASLEDLAATLFTEDTTETCKRFANDASAPVLYVIKEAFTLDDGAADDANAATEAYSYSVSQELSFTPQHVGSLVLIKRSPTLDPSRPLQYQLQFINLPGLAGANEGGVSSPYEALHSYIHLAVSPYFEAYIGSKAIKNVDVQKGKTEDNKMGIPMAKRKIAELELSLLHLQQNVEIPDVALTIHPVVQRAVDKCQAEGRRATVDDIDPALLTDSGLLNRLQNDVKSWVKEIQKVTKLSRDPASGTATQEINFWLSMEKALEQIDEQLRSDSIVLTMDILRHAKRFHATVSFIADTGLKEANEKVHKYNQLMRDFPLNELLSATDLEKLRESILLIFSHLNKKLRLSPYPIRRALPLVEAISRDLNEQMLKVMGNRRLMYMEYNDFESAAAGAEEVFRTWDEQLKEFTNVAREVTRKRSEKFLPIKIKPAHAKLQERILFVRAFRKQHEQLYQTIVKVMSAPKGTKAHIVNGSEVANEEEMLSVSDVNAVEEVKAAYSIMKDIDVLDVSPEGTEIWVDKEANYNDRVARVENQIIARLRDRLGTARNASEMFRVFSKFNALFVRPKIRGAIQEYQTQLIDSVKEDIRKLHEKFKQQYRNSEAYHMSQLRDIPPISGAIIWARQIERQLNLYMKRVEDVLGKGWELYSEGQKLQAESNSFRKKLDTRQIYENWLQDIAKKDLSVSGRLFEITKNRAQGGALQLGVNFDGQIITLFKEVRNLVWLGFQVPHTIVNVAKDAKRVYPYAVSLMDAVRSFSQTLHRVNQHRDIAMLVADCRNDVQTMINKGMNLRWDYFVNAYDSHNRYASYFSDQNLDARENRHVMFVREFASVVSIFQDKVDALIGYSAEIGTILEDLQTCPYSKESFTEHLESIQRIVDKLNLEGYSNLEQWSATVDQRIEECLLDRLQSAIDAWAQAFAGNVEDAQKETRSNAKRKRRSDNRGKDDKDILNAKLLEVELKPVVHEIRIKDQIMFLDPPIEHARAEWYRQLHSWLAIVCHLPRIKSSRYEDGLRVDVIEQDIPTFASLLTHVEDVNLRNVYTMLEDKVQEVSKYVNIWLRYQSLWDLEATQVFNILGEDLAKWQQILAEIKKARSTFDNSETEQSFGPIVIDYEQVQSKVNAKYDQWQREILNRFGGLLGTSMRDFHSAISKSRLELEQQSLDSNSTAEAVAIITFVQDLKRKMEKWTVEVELFGQGQKVLERQRYQFPQDWMYFDHINGEWSAFNEILNRKNNAIQEQIAGLQLKILAEDKLIESKIRELSAEWEKTKPVQGDVKPDNAINTLNVFEGRVERLKQSHDMLSRAKEALDLETTQDRNLEPLLEELRDLKSVWTALSGIWENINDLRDTLWSIVVPRKIRQSLDGLLASTKEMPNRMRSYAAFEHVQNTLRDYVKVNTLLTDLKSDALRERHWKQLLKGLRVDGRFTFSEMTVGHLWDIDLKRNEQIVKDVVIQAQGEMALEEFLRQVKDTWTNYVLELTNYQNKCRLIKNWDDLFQKCGENINSLTAMRLSPYYKVFEEDASSWEDKLNRMHVLFDVWIDVQRQWVYLEGIFSGNTDIKHLLPVETSRFQNINSEFLAVMKKVYKSPFILDVMAIPNVQKSLERLADLLSKIQKALGEYLERERAAFPRFYFVGDEDLLEIIGNSKEIPRIQKHFKKMFAGIANILLDDDGIFITGISSREGEIVLFKNQFSIIDHPKVNDWLSLVEREMKRTLAQLLTEAVAELNTIFNETKLDKDAYLAWMDKHPAQLVVLTVQAAWTHFTEMGLTKQDTNANQLANIIRLVEEQLAILADAVLTELTPIMRKKCEHLITELVHERNVLAALPGTGSVILHSFTWLSQMRFYFTMAETLEERLQIRMGNASFLYGFEYLGIPDRIVQTPLTDRCYLTLTHALENRLGGSPFGPAGTGKTESVKALGVQLGRFVLVFCCDETFDFKAMGRIFVGLCQVGAWGCFDEFNRLEERILSAVSQQVQTIQVGLRTGVGKANHEIELLGKQIRLNADTGIFITMNPGYAGRSNLPDNLKKLFRSIAMTKPDRQLIAQVVLYSQGFRTGDLLASKVVPFFNMCAEKLSPQSHYDFGLRALKSVLLSAGNLKRDRIVSALKQASDNADANQETNIADITEDQILIQSVQETLVPKLVAEDIPILNQLLTEVFPGVEYVPLELKDLRDALRTICEEQHFAYDNVWMDKVIQLYQIQNIHHGLMMVGPSGSGKSSAWKILLKALEKVEGVEGVSYSIDPKAISKEALYGTLDPTTREWTDGLFTHTLRKIIDNVRGESTKRHWIVFDGDVDPEWVENLNSVLDDNKLLTLPNGERLNLPPNVRIMFEVDTLKYATLATVSRCGMVWFSSDVVEVRMLLENYLSNIKAVAMTDVDIDDELPMRSKDTADPSDSPNLRVQRAIATVLTPYMTGDNCLTYKVLQRAESMEHIMDFTRMRALSTLFSLLNKTVRNVLEYNAQHPDFPMPNDHLEQYVSKRLLFSLVWSFTGDARLQFREELGEFIRNITSIDLPSQGSIIDYDVAISNCEWVPWQNKVPSVEIDTHKVADADMIIPTVDTVRHEEVLYSWLSEHKPIILCGPPGSGKTMTLFSALRKLPDMEVVGLNFSSATSPELILKTFEHYCEYRRTPNGVILAPTMIGRWLVLFCDEINLPATDKYGTQRVISFMRQLVENNGFWRTSDKSWVRLERIQFVGACNPPTDPGRVPLSHRFLRQAPLVMVDYPGRTSLTQIYSTFNRALLKVVPPLRGYAEPLTEAMVEFYLASQAHFTVETQAHYVYSPRELTRWVRGIFEAIRPLEMLSVEGLVRVWAHEALRLFQDRLVTEEERRWTDELVDSIAQQHFPTINHQEALARPILFSNWLSKNYVPVDREILRDYAKARLKVFYEEELDVQLVLFNDVLDHVLRIDRVFRQPQGHLLLIGVSGAGKTTLSRFVAWMNGLSVYQIKVHNKYTAADFDEDLRTVLRRAGCKGEKICFIMDESNVLDSGFLERMNTLLANAEVPGLFEGDEYATLMTQCKEGAQRDGVMLDSNDELYKWFTQQVMRNLHVVFTMNPPAEGLTSRAATSPALFNRCVLDWLGDWSDQAFFQVGKEFTAGLDLDQPSYGCPQDYPLAYKALEMPLPHRDAVVDAFVFVHQSLREVNAKLTARNRPKSFVTPRHYLDFINHYVRLFNEKREDLEEQQRHLNIGLDKLNSTVVKVEELRNSLAVKKTQLEAKNSEANEKLKKMVADQQEAEQKRAASLEFQANLEQQNKEIEERRSIVLKDLANAEPAVAEAQNSVRNIKKQHLTEVRSMGNPPEAVKLAMESVCTLLGHKIDGWKTVQSILRRDDFIASIINYDTEKQMSRQLREQMKRVYLSNPSFEYEIVNRASKACGPLCKWVIAQVHFSEILDKVGPLRQEVDQLSSSAEVTRQKAADLDVTLNELEASIARYKDEYAVLISETQAIKTEMERVKTKVERSLQLINDLSSEKERWEETSQTFEKHMGTIVGDVLISAAFLGYAGYFDQHYRSELVSKWMEHLGRAGIQFKPELSLTDYLSTADERLLWQNNALPADDLCVENAVMLSRFNRYPLIIDPSGQATTYLVNQFKERKLTITSFLDDAFLKNLESALRFGNPILIQDVEHLDPILNAVLNKELRRTGGRVLIRLGNQDIDFSPSFNLFLTTRDPTVIFAPDVCSRVTFVNFTVTRSSLQSQCLDKVLKAERPDIDHQRTVLMKMQGEFRLKLRHLEKSLLNALNESKGNILDDDKVIETLERLKREAAEVTVKMEDTDSIVQKVEQTTAIYTPLARACSSIFFLLEQLDSIHHFYQFSLDFFNSIFNKVLLDNPHLKDVQDSEARLQVILSDLFLTTYQRTTLTLLHDDHIMFAMLLARIKLRGDPQLEVDYDRLLDDHEISTPALPRSKFARDNEGASSEETQRLELISRLSGYGNIFSYVKEHDSEWMEFLTTHNAEKYNLPALDADGIDNPTVIAVRNANLVRSFRPDRLAASLSLWVNKVLGADLYDMSILDLANVVLKETSAATPIVLCSAPGYDASYRVDNLVKELNKTCTSVAMGSAEGLALGDQAIATASKSGTWVLLKNVHYSSAWLGQLEKRLHGMKPHSEFRLFLTMETNPKVPSNLLLTPAGIDTPQFLEATEGLIKLFDLLGSSAFSVVQNDMNGNVKKIRERYLSNPTANDTLQNLCANEVGEKKRTATEGLLWLNRGLDFTSQALRRNVDNPSEELSASFTNAYTNTLRKFHSMMVRPIFSMAMKACPYRKDFYEKLGGSNDETVTKMNAWLTALEGHVATLNRLFDVEHPEYSKH